MGLDPIRDPRWPELLNRHPGATVFHTPGWLEALRRTYGYEPGVLTTAEREELAALRREVRTLKQEREILKKATAFFVREGSR